MVWAESVSQDIARAVAALSTRYGVPVLSVHAPCLLISQRVWGANPIPKLERSVRAAEQLGAQTVVVHPPFRWQRRYAEGFSDQVAGLEAEQRGPGGGGEHVPVPGRPVLRGERHVDRADAQTRRQARPGHLGVRAVLRPAGRQPRALHARPVATPRRRAPTPWTWPGGWARAWSTCICATATGASTDEHLVPGRGTQPTAEVCRMLAASDFSGHVVLEVTTSAAKTAAEREALLTESLQFARTHLLR